MFSRFVFLVAAVSQETLLVFTPSGVMEVELHEEAVEPEAGPEGSLRNRGIVESWNRRIGDSFLIGGPSHLRNQTLHHGHWSPAR